MPAPDLRIGRRLRRAVLGGLAVVVLAATPAAADPAGPTDFRAEVTGIVPAVGGLDVEIRGGDAFLEVTVEPGHLVVVMGYQGEPYLRFRPDGTVERNRSSAATYLNDDRRGASAVPSIAQDPLAEPEWVPVGTGGSYAWHDHRIHWMSDVTPSVERGRRVPGAYDPWKVPLEVDGTRVEVQGTLTYATATSPLPWVALAIAVAGLLAWFGRRAAWSGPAALAVGAAAAVVVGRSDFSSTPGGGNPLLWILPSVALVAGLLAAVRPRRAVATVAALGSVACLSGWGLLRLQVFAKPILPTTLPFWFDRATTATALGVSVAAAFLAVTSSQFGFAPLEDD